jgi:hypothetical protein
MKKPSRELCMIVVRHHPPTMTGHLKFSAAAAKRGYSIVIIPSRRLQTKGKMGSLSNVGSGDLARALVNKDACCLCSARWR